MPPNKRRLVIRRPTRNTDERTCIAALLPEQSCFGDTLTAVDVEQDKQNLLLVILNSFALDYEVRQRVAGRDLRPYQLSVLAVPPPSSLEFSQPVTCISQGGKTQWVYEIERHWELLAEVELAVAEAYGLDADDVEHILSTFPVFARKRPAFSAYLLERVAEWRTEAGKSAAQRSTSYKADGHSSAQQMAAEQSAHYGRADRSQDTG
jgi:hypothetical protein